MGYNHIPSSVREEALALFASGMRRSQIAAHFGVKTNTLDKWINRRFNMGRKIDLTGQRFGRLMVISEGHSRPNSSRYWNCACDCGNVSLVYMGSLHRHNNPTRSCGCLQREICARPRKRSNGRYIHESA